MDPVCRIHSLCWIFSLALKRAAKCIAYLQRLSMGEFIVCIKTPS